MNTKKLITADELQSFYGAEHLSKISAAKHVAFDCETLQLQPESGKLRLLQLGAAVNKTIVIIDLFEVDDASWDLIDDFLESKNRSWVAHNAVFDLGWLQENGFTLNGKVIPQCLPASCYTTAALV